MNYSKNDYYADQQFSQNYDRNDPESYNRGQEAKMRLSQNANRFQNKNQMSYNNNYNNNQGGNYRSNNNGYQPNYNNNNRRGYSNNNQGNYNNQGNNQPKKHSGCVAGQDKNGNPYVRGWKFDKQNGMRSFFAAPYKNTKNVTSKSGKEWENWMVKVSPTGGQSYIVSGLYDVATKRVIIQEMGYIMSPKGGKGGYTGALYIRKN